MTAKTAITHETDLWEQYERALQTHDWYYYMSDDQKYYHRGQAEAAKIKQLKERLSLIDAGKVEALYKKYEQRP